MESMLTETRRLHKKMESMLWETRKLHKKMERTLTETRKLQKKISIETRKRHKKISRSMTKAELPLSLIESHILPRLPAKSVGRCICVCKQWKLFLSTPMFARAHLRYLVTINENYKLLQLYDEPPAATFRTLDGSSTMRCIPNPGPCAEFILASMDGLVCLALRENQLAFWNPLTGAYKKLSSRPDFKFSLYADAVSFYVDSSNDYKLLYLVKGGGLGAYIYSTRLDSWREIVSPVSLCELCRCSQATLYGQCLYFTLTYLLEGGSWVICFDVKTESFRKIRFPPVPGEDGDYYGCLVVLNGRLHLCVSYTNYKSLKQGDMWRMNGDGNAWVNVATFQERLTLYNCRTRRQHICTATTAGNWLVVWDQESNCFKEMNTEEFTKEYWYFCSPGVEHRSSRMIYVETLVSPNP